MIFITNQIRKYFPALAFFAGFIWDALTIGRNVAASDLIIFAGYLLAAGLILFCISRPSFTQADGAKLTTRLYAIVTSRWPYFLSQLFFHSLF